MATVMEHMLCPNVSNMPGPAGVTTVMTEPLVALAPPFLPTTFSFGIVIGIGDLQSAKNTRIIVAIKDPNGETIQNIVDDEFPTDPDLDDNSRIARYNGAVIAIQVHNLLLRMEGMYTAEVQINGVVMEPIRIPVYAGSPS